MKKKLLIVAFALILVLSVVFGLAACQKDTQDVTLEIVAPDGAPALALARMMKENPTYKGYKITYRVVPAANIGTEILASGVQMGILPTNAAANLYNKGQDVKLLGTATQGNLYMVGGTQVESLSELVGNVVYNIGQGQVPDQVFKAILTAAGLPFEASETPVEGKVALAYVADGPTLIPMLKSGIAKFGVLGEPAVSQAINAGAGALSRLFSLQELYNDYTGTQNGFPQASLVVKGAFQSAHADFVNWFVSEMQKSNGWLEEHPAEALEAVKAAGSTSIAALNAQIAEKSNTLFRTGAEEKARIEAFLSAFPVAAIGGKLPDAAFYLNI